MSKTFQPHKSSIGGLDANLVALLCYVISFIFSFIPIVKYFAWLAPLVLFFFEKDSYLVRFHAIQAFLVGIAYAVVYGIFSLLLNAIFAPSFMDLLSGSTQAGITVAILWIITAIFDLAQLFAMYKAFKYDAFELPFIGKIAKVVVSKF